MTKLNSAQQAILEKAAHDDGVVAAEVDARSAAGMIKRGFLISLPRDGAPSRLLITQHGRNAAGLAEAIAAEPPTVIGAPRAAPTSTSKTATMQALLARAEGVTVAQMTEATGWLPHSVRGFLAGTLKKKLGLNVTSEKGQGGRIYRIVEPAA